MKTTGLIKSKDTFETLDTRIVKEIYYLPDTYSGISERLIPKEDQYLMFFCEYLGDRSEIYVALKRKPDGLTLRIINFKYIAEIIFDEVKV